MTTETWPDIAGRLIEVGGDQRSFPGGGRRHHILPVRVYFEDTDAGGIVYHGSFVRWCERGRTDFLRLIGTDARRLIDGSDSHEPAAFVVRRMNFDFAKPARMDEVLEIVTSVVELGGASIRLKQVVQRGGVRVCEADVTVVLVSVSGKPLRLSTAVRGAMGNFAATPAD